MKLIKLSMLVLSLGMFATGCRDTDATAGDDDLKGAPEVIPKDTLASGTNAAGMGPDAGRTANDTIGTVNTASVSTTTQMTVNPTPAQNSTNGKK